MNHSKHSHARRAPRAALASTFFAITVAAASPSPAFLGDCSQPVSNGPSAVASDCLFILKAAVGSLACAPECICAPKGSLPVSATDALLCLKNVVGQAVPFNCSCPVTTTSTTTSTSSTTTSTSMPETPEMFVLTKRGNSYATSELAGTWRLHSIVTGAGEPDRTRGVLTMQGNGNFSGTETDIDGTTENVSGRLTLSQSGLVSCDICGPAFRGVLDAQKTIIVATDTWSDGSTEFMVLLKQAAGYAQGDLTGGWQLNGITSGLSEPFWMRGPVRFRSSGAMSGTLENSYGGTDQAGGLVTLNSNGLGLCSGCQGAAFEGTIDAGKTVAMLSETLADGSTEFGLMTRDGGSFSQSDLAGTWEANGIVSGSFDDGWERGTLKITTNGSISGQINSTLDAPDQAAGQLLLSSSGVVTVADDPNLRCVMDPGKTLVVCTGFY